MSTLIALKVLLSGSVIQKPLPLMVMWRSTPGIASAFGSRIESAALSLVPYSDYDVLVLDIRPAFLEISLGIGRRTLLRPARNVIPGYPGVCNMRIRVLMAMLARGSSHRAGRSPTPVPYIHQANLGAETSETTILYKLKLGKVVTTIPTIGFHVEIVRYKNISCTVWNVGGQDKICQFCKHYYHNTQGLLFVVDSSDRDRIEDAKQELKKC